MRAPQLDREEYIEQAYFFRIFNERLKENLPSQDILANIHEEILSTTKLPMALEFLTAEILLHGRISAGMARLSHYFAPFQTFVMSRADEERAKFDHSLALKILEREAEYRADAPTPAGLFIYQFECISRNRLGYDDGMTAMAGDPLFNEDWRDWILKIRRQLGSVDFADFIYLRSQHAVDERRRQPGQADYEPKHAILFEVQEGRIAKAHRGKDPLFMFSALQRQLKYPTIPRPKPKTEALIVHPVLEQRFQQLEKRVLLMEQEAKGGFDLSEFYVKPPAPLDPPPTASDRP